uniref:Ig-like domain-containing protein n=1 Tax=Mola mola TaxID=94237 RepID=A0A3Q4B6J5_MOLML
YRQLMKMMKMMVVLVLSFVLCVSADSQHNNMRIVGCSEVDGEEMYGLDGEELWYADFANNKGVYPQPPFIDPFIYKKGIYEQAVQNQQVCKTNLGIALKGNKDVPLEFDPPSSPIMYPKDEVEDQQQNTLICYVTGFYPAPVNVSWTKNEQKVTVGPTINTPYPNKDGSFTQVSRLDFIPRQGDIYSCTVEHPALTEPLTQLWEVELKQQVGVGPAVFCGLGLTIGLLGVAAGTFFLIKGNECR